MYKQIYLCACVCRGIQASVLQGLGFDFGYNFNVNVVPGRVFQDGDVLLFKSNMIAFMSGLVVFPIISHNVSRPASTHFTYKNPWLIIRQLKALVKAVLFIRVGGDRGSK